jgi:protein SCO1/2
MSLSKRNTVLAVLALSALLFAGYQLSSPHTHGDMPSPDESSLNEASAAPGGGTYLTSPIEKRVLNLDFVDQTGATFTLGDFKGRYVVISNFLTSCQEVCPMTTANMRVIADRIAKAGFSNQIKVVEITVDGPRDTPDRLAAYQALYGASNWTLATGTSENLGALWDYFGVPPERMDYTDEQKATFPKDWQTGKTGTYDVMHSDLVMIIDPDSTWRWLDLGHPATVDGKVPAKLRAYLNDEGIEHLEKPDGDAWTVKGVLAALSQLLGQEIAL